ncbi:MAG: glycosyltransferase [Polyangiaceae bacterium]|nr:glycosyltransferase [Polyangiaceae bacterium]
MTIKLVEIPEGPSLAEYATSMLLSDAVEDLRATVGPLVPGLAGRTIWMANSTARGGGVAEMLPRVVGVLNEIGVATKWVVIGTDKLPFFDLTKRMHNLIHGAGTPELSAADRALYDEVSTDLARELRSWVGPEDILFIHDPQPAGMGAKVKDELGLKGVWRCHIGLDRDLPQTRAAWSLLEPYISRYDRAVFTAREYIPAVLTDRARLIRPALDPFGYKNREFRAPELVSILVAAGLVRAEGDVLPEPFSRPAERLQPDGSFRPATEPDDLGIFFRPTITQISRWDRLKGWKALLDGFVLLKQRGETESDPELRGTIGRARILMGGPEPAAVADDPEAKQVLEELRSTYMGLPPAIQRDVALLSLPMTSHRENQLMVSALQYCSTIVVQNSVQEGFGLTVTEAMWKGTPLVVSNACGIRQQVRPGVDGLMVDDAHDSSKIAAALRESLADPTNRALMARNARRRVRDQFLIFNQIKEIVQLLAEMVG